MYIFLLMDENIFYIYMKKSIEKYHIIGGKRKAWPRIYIMASVTASSEIVNIIISLCEKERKKNGWRI